MAPFLPLRPVVLEVATGTVTFKRVMSTFTRHLYCIVTALFVVGANTHPSLAENPHAELLEELKTADPARAAQIVRQVEREWRLSGSTSIDMLVRRGQEAMDEENWRLAIEHFTAVTDHAPDFAEGYHARASAYYRVGKFGPALDDLGRALALNPRNWNTLYGLGILFRELEEYGNAEKAFRAALDLHPHHEEAAEALKQIAKFGVGQTL